MGGSEDLASSRQSGNRRQRAEVGRGPICQSNRLPESSLGLPWSAALRSGAESLTQSAPTVRRVSHGTTWMAEELLAGWCYCLKISARVTQLLWSPSVVMRPNG